mmetsp:Transcript_30748/g.66255  ORF Transcript_30748/g.66255 Transcript_30748/m.66255 type:complete len:328 (-) Transcript_30748:541-1524(-)
MQCYHIVSRLDHVHFLGFRQRFGNHRVCALERRSENWHDAAICQHLSQRWLTCCDGQNWAGRSILGNHSCRVSGFCQSDNEFAISINDCLHCRRANRLDRAHDVRFQSCYSDFQIQCLVVHHPLSHLANVTHGCNCLFRELATGSLAGEHHNIRAIQNCVQDIRCFSTSRSRSALHGIQHLGGGHHEFTFDVAFADDHLLHQTHLFNVNFHAHVTTSNHDTISSIDDLIDVVDALLILNLRDNLDAAPAHAQSLADQLDVLSILYKASRNEIDCLWNTKLQQVLFVFLLQHRQVNLHARKIHVFLLANGDVIHDLCDYVIASTAFDL